MRRSLIFAVALAASLVIPASSPAGTYTVHSCKAAEDRHGVAWSFGYAKRGSFGADGLCTDRASLNIYAQPTSSPMERDSHISLNFEAPAGTTIEDFELSYAVRYLYRSSDGTPVQPPTSGAMWVLLRYGDSNATGIFAGGGRWTTELEDRLYPDWWGLERDAAGNRKYSNFIQPANGAYLTRTMADFHGTHGQARTARSLGVFLGCSSDCVVTGSDEIKFSLYASSLTIRDDGLPAASLGGALLDPGLRNGNEALVVQASDASGIRRAEVRDLTNGGAVVAAMPTSCQFTRPKPCGDLDGSLTGHQLAAGRHELQLVVEDAAGNVTATAPVAVEVRSLPSTTTLPSVTGTVRVGSALTATRGSWLHADALHGVWERCESGLCTALPHTDLTYRVSKADLGANLRYVVTAANQRGTTTAASAMTKPIRRPLVALWTIRPGMGGRALRIGPLAPRSRVEVRCVRICRKGTAARRSPTLGGYATVPLSALGIRSYGSEFVVSVRRRGAVGRWQRYRVTPGRTRPLHRRFGCLDGKGRRVRCSRA